MLQSFLKFLELGLYHILNFDGYDHILFVIIVSVPFIFKDWKRLLILVSVFTLGHTLSLILGVYDIVNLNVNVTEWLIPITIFFMAVYNIFTAAKSIKSRLYLLYGIVLFFSITPSMRPPALHCSRQICKLAKLASAKTSDKSRYAALSPDFI